MERKLLVAVTSCRRLEQKYKVLRTRVSDLITYTYCHDELCSEEHIAFICKSSLVFSDKERVRYVKGSNDLEW